MSDTLTHCFFLPKPSKLQTQKLSSECRCVAAVGADVVVGCGDFVVVAVPEEPLFGGGGAGRVEAAAEAQVPAGMNCIKIGLPGKLILSKRKGLQGPIT